MEVLRQRIQNNFVTNWKAFKAGSENFTGINEKDLRAVYSEFDVDGNGSVDENELKSCIKQLDKTITDQEISKMFSSADANRDNTISFDEFAHIDIAHPLAMAYKTVFKEFDKDGDGEITKVEMQNVFTKWDQNVNAADIEAIFKHSDADGDGKINFEEFVVLLRLKK